MFDLLQAPEQYYDKVRRYSTGVILSIIFGMRAPEWSDAREIYDVMDPWSESAHVVFYCDRCPLTPSMVVETGATPPVDIFPWIKRLPDALSGWRKKALHVRHLELAVRSSFPC